MGLTDKLSAIANAIREKSGKEDPMTMDQMVEEIINLGGGYSDLGAGFSESLWNRTTKYTNGSCTLGNLAAVSTTANKVGHSYVQIGPMDLRGYKEVRANFNNSSSYNSWALLIVTPNLAATPAAVWTEAVAGYTGSAGTNSGKLDEATGTHVPLPNNNADTWNLATKTKCDLSVDLSAIDDETKKSLYVYVGINSNNSSWSNARSVTITSLLAIREGRVEVS